MGGAATGPRPPARVTSPRGGVVRGVVARVGRARSGGSAAEPWLADHPWRRDAAEDESGRDVRNALVGGGVLTVAASAMGAFLLPRATGGMAVLPAVVLGAFLLVGLWFLGTGVLTLLRRSRHGVAELRLARFPFFLGEPLDATLVRQGPAAPLPGLHARLTCVAERWGRPTGHATEPFHEATRRRLERVDRWSETRPVLGAVGSRIPIRFDLPPPGPDALGTELSAELPRYWELEVWAELPGLDFHAVFLVPVYQRPGTRPPPL